jgi:hypothetical protein
MRHIDKSKFIKCKTNTWDIKSKEWSSKIKKSANPTLEIDNIGNQWTSLKRSFVAEFGAKCWYTETPQSGADNDVDHFWPKGRVKLEDGVILKGPNGQHPGYWWKAFDIDNYRIACTYANRSREGGGKVDYFPLADETHRAWGDHAPCDYNHRIILDPCSLEDVQLISFEIESGKVVSIYLEHQNPEAYKRVKLSRTILNLDEKSIAPLRLKAMRNMRKALTCLRLFYGMENNEQEDLDEIEDAKKLIIEGCDRKSEFSAALVQTVLPYTTAPYLAEIIGQLDLEP